MIYFGSLILINGTKYKVGFRHNMPLDPVNGMGKTQEELEKSGVLIDTLPDPQPPAGMTVANTYVDTATKAVTYEYVAVGDSTGQTYNPNDLDSVKAYKKAQINKTAGEKIDGGFYSYAEGCKDGDGNPVSKLYKSDRNHREQLNSLHALADYHTAGRFMDTKCCWKDADCADESCHEITDACAQQLFAECGMHLLWNKKTADELTAQVAAATSVEAVNEISFPMEPMPANPEVPEKQDSAKRLKLFARLR